MVHPFDDPIIIPRRGTIGLEVIEDYPQLDTILLPLSSGGVVRVAALLSGKVRNLGQSLVVVLSGANVSMPTFMKLMTEDVTN